MKIAQFSTFPYGGAATAAKRLHRQLLSSGIDSRFYFHRNKKDKIDEPGFHQLEFLPNNLEGISNVFVKHIERRRQKQVYRQFNEHLAVRPEGFETFSMARLPQLTEVDWQAIDADVIHLHWISFFADYSSFFASIPNEIPIVWTLHDMNAFTGGCHYSGGCNRFQFGCGGCPQVNNSGPSDVSVATYQAKQRALKQKKIHVVSPSDWMKQLAMQSNVFPESTSFQTIRLGFDLSTFFPMPKRAAKKQLGINENSTLIAFGCEDITNKRKGMHHLLEALKNLNTENQAECLVFGSGELPDDPSLPPVHSIGYVDSEEKQALVYSAADMVVIPSREDNQPQVGLEAMACGTPVIGFQAGGIPEYVRRGTTGLIAETGNEQQLAAKIGWLVDNPSARKMMGRRARLMMEQEFEISKQTEKYLQLYFRSTHRQRIAA